MRWPIKPVSASSAQGCTSFYPQGGGRPHEKRPAVRVGVVRGNFLRQWRFVGGRCRILGLRSSMPTEGQGSAGVRPEQPSASVTAGDRVSKGARSSSGTAGCCQAINSGGLGAAPPSPHIPGSADRTEALSFHPNDVPRIHSFRLSSSLLADGAAQSIGPCTPSAMAHPIDTSRAKPRNFGVVRSRRQSGTVRDRY
jgi:hypothetical protein